MVANFQKNLLDLHMTFKAMAKVKLKIIMTIEGQEVLFENLP